MESVNFPTWFKHYQEPFKPQKTYEIKMLCIHIDSSYINYPIDVEKFQNKKILVGLDDIEYDNECFKGANLSFYQIVEKNNEDYIKEMQEYDKQLKEWKYWKNIYEDNQQCLSKISRRKMYENLKKEFDM